MERSVNLFVGHFGGRLHTYFPLHLALGIYLSRMGEFTTWSVDLLAVAFVVFVQYAGSPNAVILYGEDCLSVPTVFDKADQIHTTAEGK